MSIQDALVLYFQQRHIPGLHDIDSAQGIINKYLSHTKFPNLLGMDYGPAIRLVGESLFQELNQDHLLTDIPHIGIIIVILAGLRKKTRVPFIFGKGNSHLNQIHLLVENFLRKDNGTFDISNSVSIIGAYSQKVYESLINPNFSKKVGT